MKLNDPFGRAQRKQQSSYESLRHSLLAAGVTTREGAEIVLKNLMWRALAITLLVGLVTIGLVIFLPNMSAAVLTFAFVILSWLAVTTLNGYSFVRRFIRDELSDL
ncbi:hypothetical protein [Sedimenticola sp.]|uniref:hypothetical protein n=1 Tax=Sedimenticola sp. TaxID=1940285 RepID=UPI003D0CA1CE